MNVLFLSPEPPYPLHSGGAYRIASLLHYFAQYADVDLLLLSESDQPSAVPPGLIRSQKVIPLAPHSKSHPARYLRNARRAIQGISPLIDRLSGLENQIAQTLSGKKYDLGIIEHFWCAPYIRTLEKTCAKTVLDLHNVESVLHERSAATSTGLVKAGHNRFAAASRKLEAELLPRFSHILATSEADARTALAIAPRATVGVYPNSFPCVDIPCRTEQPMVVFPANFEYHPNIDAVQFLLRDIWPAVRRAHPDLILRLVGRGDHAIRRLLPDRPADYGIETTGPIPDALAEIAQASIVVAPLRSGSGTRVKILEAWAAARPVVATPLAAEGLDVTDRENILLAADGPAFAAAIDSLLGSESERRRIGASGRHIFENSYSWNAAWKTLDLDPQLMRGFGLKRYTGTSDAIRR